LAFGVIYHDGYVGVTPPIKRALEMTVEVLKKQGHEVISWNPPAHRDINDCALNTWMYDGGLDLLESFQLSGEPMAPQLAGAFGEPREQFTGSMIAANNVRQRELKKNYMDYWNSTASQTTSGRPVDAIISPIAPFPAARPKMYGYYGYSIWVNLLDYTSVVVPITNVDKSIDVIDKGYQPKNAEDKACYESCKFLLPLPNLQRIVTETQSR
jgi:amidase